MWASVVYERNQHVGYRKPVSWQMKFWLKSDIINGISAVKERRDDYAADAGRKQNRLKPKNDFIFKRLFGEPNAEAEEALISLLNAIFGLEGDQKLATIKIVEDKKLTQKMIEDKTGRLDILALTDDDGQINLEMQLVDKKNMGKRTLFYHGKLYVHSIESGGKYFDLKRTITVNFLDFNFLPHEPFHSVYRLYEENRRDLLTDVLEVHFIEFPKFKKASKDLSNPLHRWLMFFDENISEEQIKELVEMDPVIKKTEDRLMQLSSDKATRRLYEYREHSRIERNSIFDSGKQEGREEGREEGLQEGLQRGKQKGREEGKLEVARNLLQRGASLEEVKEITGLFEEQLREIK